MSLSTSVGPEISYESPTRRRSDRYRYLRQADWDFFTAANGVKPGFVENVSQGGCLLRGSEPIEIRRWIRLVVKDPGRALWFTAVGRIVHRTDEMQAWDGENITLYRYGVEFVNPLNPAVLNAIREQETTCATCGSEDASVPDPDRRNALNCVLCHLRKACQNLLVTEGFEPA